MCFLFQLNVAACDAPLSTVDFSPESAEDESSLFCLRFGAEVNQHQLPALAQLSTHAAGKSIHVPSYTQPISSTELPRVAEEALADATVETLFIPVLEAERRARLACLYRMPDGTFGACLSDANVSAWAKQVVAVLSETAPPEAARPGVAAMAAAPAPPESTQPAARSPDASAPLVTLGDVQTRHTEFGRHLMVLAKLKAELGVLILGETGTGKGHLAQAIHARSSRARGPMLTVNCAGIAADLMESELFGHQRGSFTGAHERAGLVASANGGTLFLDEIGDAPMRVQLSLLRLLDERLYRPVGADREKQANVRIIAATSADLDERVSQGVFKQDLYYRLAATVVTVPPLRERQLDLPLLCTQLLKRHSASRVHLSSEAQKWAISQRWPGNIRELQNALVRAVGLSDGARRLAVTLFEDSRNPAADGPELTAPSVKSLPELERQAHELWAGRSPIFSSDAYLRRAEERAALYVLSLKHGPSTWPAHIKKMSRRVYRYQWHLSEDGRGKKQLLRHLELNPYDNKLSEQVLSWIERF